jgi:lipopolysaccharide export system permease protein
LLDRYIGRAIASSTVLVMLVLLAIYTFLSFADELRDVGQGRYDLWAALEYVLLTLPGRIYDLFPATALLGTLLGLGGLAGTSELIVMRAAGVSVSRIGWAVMKVGIVLVAMVIILGEWLAPVSEQYAKVKRSIAVSGQIAMVSRKGFWVRDKLTFINIRQVLPGVRLGDISIYAFDEQRRLEGTAHAGEAAYLNNEWLLRDIRLNRIDEEGVITEKIPEARWDTLLSPELVNVLVVEPDNLSALGLYRYIHYLRANRQDATRYVLALWVKLVMPIATGAMVFLAVPFVFGPLRSVGMGQRILAGSLVGLGFYLGNRTLNHVGLAYDLNPVFSATFPTLVFLGLALWLMYRVR